jgi:hypothetical protein
MSHPIYKVVDFEIVGPYTVKVVFDDGSAQVINFLPVLEGELYKPLQDMKLFNQLKIDPQTHTLVWPNGADFDPETLHDWPKIFERDETFSETVENENLFKGENCCWSRNPSSIAQP